MPTGQAYVGNEEIDACVRTKYLDGACAIGGFNCFISELSEDFANKHSH